MARSPAQKTSDAADKLLGWLVTEQAATRGGMADAGQAGQGLAGAGMAGQDPPPPAPAAHPDRDTGQAAPLLARAGEGRGPGAALRLPHPDWLHHRLVVTGAAAEVAAFRAAAAGPGEVPWPLDPGHVEENMLHLLLWPPPPGHRVLSAAGARALAGQLREAAALRHGAVPPWAGILCSGRTRVLSTSASGRPTGRPGGRWPRSPGAGRRCASTHSRTTTGHDRPGRRSRGRQRRATQPGNRVRLGGAAPGPLSGRSYPVGRRL